MATTQELADMLRAMPPEQLMQLVPQIQVPVPEKPAALRVKIYPSVVVADSDASPPVMKLPPALMVWAVDVKDWLATGAKLTPQDPVPSRRVDPVEELEVIDQRDALAVSRESWKSANPGKKPPPRAGLDWYEKQRNG